MAKAKRDDKKNQIKKNLTLDVAIVGGGLAGCLLALRLRDVHPELNLLLFEEAKSLGGHHTWCFHSGDVKEASRLWVDPLLTKSWDRQMVRFPKFEKTLEQSYHSIRSEDFAQKVAVRLQGCTRTQAQVEKVDTHSVILANGEAFSARLVVDARGWQPTNTPICAYQKFFGMDVVLEEPHGINFPIVMDFTCPQLDGMRFFYLLPWDEKSLLIEETYYSDQPDLNLRRTQRSIESFAGRKGWKIKTVARQEKGILAIPLSNEDLKRKDLVGPAVIGTRGSYFHSVTGYSLADAVRVAELISQLSDLTTENAQKALKSYRAKFVRVQTFYRMLNRMLFRASEPSERYEILQKFYQLNDDVIARFYAGKTTWFDRMKILSGKPPIRIQYALQFAREQSLRKRVVNPANEGPAV